jgi:hypothetical protein
MPLLWMDSSNSLSFLVYLFHLGVVIFFTNAYVPNDFLGKTLLWFHRKLFTLLVLLALGFWQEISILYATWGKIWVELSILGLCLPYFKITSCFLICGILSLLMGLSPGIIEDVVRDLSLRD